MDVTALPMLITGSSPLTRGKPGPRCAHTDHEGLIPAHAGKTHRGMCRRRAKTAHPRSRGENCKSLTRATPEGGSSPLTRGKHAGLRGLRGHRGLIPAHAGKTGRRRHHLLRRPAHPRSRGENRKPATCVPVGGGSSPLTRGKRQRVDITQPRVRLIPAHAGKTVLRDFGAVAWAAHPRSRGENVLGGVHH